MIIPVTCPGGAAGTPEWFLLECQGKVLPAGSLGAGARLDGHLMGRLDPAPAAAGGAGAAAAAAAGARYQLQVGTYRMTGALKQLAKPLLVLRRARQGADADAAAAMDEEADGGGAGGAGAGGAGVEERVEYVVHAVIRRRFVFQDRPQQMVGTAAQSKSSAGARGKEDA